jgi:hypothetical protein
MKSNEFWLSETYSGEAINFGPGKLHFALSTSPRFFILRYSWLRVARRESRQASHADGL